MLFFLTRNHRLQYPKVIDSNNMHLCSIQVYKTLALKKISVDPLRTKEYDLFYLIDEEIEARL